MGPYSTQLFSRLRNNSTFTPAMGLNNPTTVLREPYSTQLLSRLYDSSTFTHQEKQEIANIILNNI